MKTHALLAAGLLMLAGCASFDPNNIIGRQLPSMDPVPASGGTLSVSARETAFDFVWDTIDRNYYDPRMNGVDWKKVRDTYRPRALAAANDEAFWDELDRMTGELRDSHTRVESPSRVDQRKRNEAVTLGLSMAWIESKLIVASVNNQGDAWWAGIRPGMEVKSIDGVPARTAYDALLKATRDSSSERARHISAIGRLNRGEVGTSVQIEVLRADGTPIAATLKRNRLPVPPSATTRALPSGFGYIRFSNFVGSLTDNILRGMKELKDAPGLIIDLRGNGGGSLAMTRDLLSGLFRTPTQLSRQLTRRGQPITLGFGLVEVIKLEYTTPANPEAYTGPVVVLVNEGSGSASEYFAATLQATRRATIVGQTSCGCLLGFLGYANIPGGGEMAYSEIGFVSPTGQRIEGDGVKPDLAVPLSISDLQLYRDRPLEMAEMVLRAEVEKKKARQIASLLGWWLSTHRVW